MTHDEWRARRNTSTKVSKQVVQRLADLSREAEDPACQEEMCTSRTQEEELVSDLDLRVWGSPRAEWPQVQSDRLRPASRSLAMCGAAAALIATLFDFPRPSGSKLWPQVAMRFASGTDVRSSMLHVL